MIGTVFRISLLRLWNNKHEVVLALAVPIMFFSIFALIFSRGVGETVRQVRVTFVDDDKTLESRAIIQAACRHQEIQPTNGLWRTDADWPIEKLSKLLISQKAAEVVVHIPAGFTTQDPQAPNLSIQLYNEGTNPIAHRVVQAGLAESIALQFAEANMEAAFAQRPAVQPASATRLVTTPSTSTATSSSFSSPQTGSAHQRNDQRTDQRTEQRSPSVATSRGEEQQVFQSIDVFATNKHQPKIALYAAGIAVMFLLFSASGTGASLLEEREAGTLGRLMTSRLSVTELVLGKWLFAAALGSVQLVIMFVWGQVMFRVDLLGHIPGFVAMTSLLGCLGKLCSISRYLVPQSSTTAWHLHRVDSRHVSSRGQHGPTLHHERLDEAVRQVHIQWLGTGWISESVLVRHASACDSQRTVCTAIDCYLVGRPGMPLGSALEQDLTCACVTAMHPNRAGRHVTSSEAA